MKHAVNRPILLGVFHEPTSDQTTYEKLKKIFDKASTTPQKLFVEYSEAIYAKRLAEGSFDPHMYAVHLAREKGWKIVFMGKQLSKFIPTIGTLGIHPNQTARYLIMNIRERIWGIRIRKIGVHPGDIIIVHPEHVSGLLHEGQLKGIRTVYLNKPRNIGWKRLTPFEKKKMDQLRNQRRIERRERRLLR